MIKCEKDLEFDLYADFSWINTAYETLIHQDNKELVKNIIKHYFEAALMLDEELEKEIQKLMQDLLDKVIENIKNQEGER